jgi:hypothetical protein
MRFFSLLSLALIGCASPVLTPQEVRAVSSGGALFVGRAGEHSDFYAAAVRVDEHGAVRWVTHLPSDVFFSDVYIDEPVAGLYELLLPSPKNLVYPLSEDGTLGSPESRPIDARMNPPVQQDPMDGSWYVTYPERGALVMRIVVGQGISIAASRRALDGTEVWSRTYPDWHFIHAGEGLPNNETWLGVERVAPLDPVLVHLLDDGTPEFAVSARY